MTRAASGSALCAIVLGVVLAGCGVDIDDRGADAETLTVERSSQSEEQARERRGTRLPKRAAGELAIAGESQGSLSSNAVKEFSAAQRQVRPRYAAVGSTTAFARLCRGEVDVVDSARRISRAELAVCNSNGLDIRTPIQIASDAIVLATRNESDIGGDCLTVEDVRGIYRRGSTIDNWQQLGFDDLPLTTSGPDQNANAFSNFASQVLGVLSGATLADLRSDYQPHASDDAVRKDIIGELRLRRARQLIADEQRRARAAAAGSRRIYVGNAVAAARDRVLRAIRAENSRRVRRKEAVADPAALAQRNLRRVEDAKRRARDRAGAIFDGRLDARRASRSGQLLERARRTGVVGFVRFSYYEVYEDQLRPVEIDSGMARDAALAAADRRARAAGATPPERLPASDAEGNRTPNCIFPSQQTITTGEYPLSRRILLYTSTRGLQRAELRSFLAYVLRNAQQLAIRSRLVPITNRLQAEQYRFVTGAEIEPEKDRLVQRDASPTTTSPPSSDRQSTTGDDGASAAASNRVPGVSSATSDTREEFP